MKQNEKEWGVFVRRFQTSRTAIFKVAEYLHREKGLNVAIPSMVLSPNVSSSMGYSDKGDLFVWANGKKTFIIDVKHKQIDFTCAENFPFQDEYIMVASVASVTRLPAFAYFVVNRQMTHAFVVKGDTKHLWHISHVKDKERGDSEDKYMCYIGLGEFVEL